MAALAEEVSPSHSRVLSSGIYQLLLQRRMLDVTITCGGEAIMAHKAVLVAYSKFLDTVFAGQGDDCDVLNMDNLGLEFEAIRAVIFFMYKGVVDTERCGDSAFQQAAKVLCVDTSTQPSKEPAATKPEAQHVVVPTPVPTPSTPIPINPQPAHPQSVQQAQSARPVQTVKQTPTKPMPKGCAIVKRMIDRYTMTEQQKITKLSRDTQTESEITGLPENEESQRKKKPRNAYVQTDSIPVSTSQEKTAVPPILKDLGLGKAAGKLVQISSEVISSKKVIPPSPKSTTTIKVHKSTPTKPVVVKTKIGVPAPSPIPAKAAPEEKVVEVSTPVVVESQSKRVTRGKNIEDEPSDEEQTPSSSGIDHGTPIRVSARKRKLTEKMKDNPLLEKEISRAQAKNSPRIIVIAPIAEEEDSPPTEKRRPGRPKKHSVETPTIKTEKPSSVSKPVVAIKRMQTTPTVKKVETEETPKRGRGRPRKYPVEESPKYSKNGAASLSKTKKLNTMLKPKGRKNVVDSAGSVTVKQEDSGTEGEATDPSDSAESDYYSDEDTLYRPKGPVQTHRTRAKSDLHSEGKRDLWQRTTDGGYQCLMCDWYRDSSRSLTVHLRIHLGEKPFECEHCGKAFRTSDKRRDHVRIHTGERPFICPVCSRKFSTRKNMTRHKEIHTKMPRNPYLCEECGRGFYSVKRLASHINRHNILGPDGKPTRTPIECQIENCDFHTLDKNTMIYHLAEVHGHALPADMVTVCTVCGASVRKTSLRMHMMIHAAKNIKCDHCSFVTQYTQTLKGHMRRLHGINLDGTEAVKPYQCEICPEAYFSRQQLRYHVMRHSGEKPNYCPICDFRTVDKGSMNMHIRTHTGVTPYSCEHCGKQFKQSSALSWHIKTVHFGIRRYSCKQCNKHYVNRKDLRAHRFSKHLYIKPFSCAICNFACTKKDYMISHIEKVHGAEFVPKELKGVKNMMNMDMNVYEGESDESDDEEYVGPATSSVAQISHSISTIEESPENLPLLIVPENTMKDLLVESVDGEESDDGEVEAEEGSHVEYSEQDEAAEVQSLAIKYEDNDEEEDEYDEEDEEGTENKVQYQKVPAGHEEGEGSTKLIIKLAKKDKSVVSDKNQEHKAEEPQQEEAQQEEEQEQAIAGEGKQLEVAEASALVTMLKQESSVQGETETAETEPADAATSLEMEGEKQRLESETNIVEGTDPENTEQKPEVASQYVVDESLQAEVDQKEEQLRYDIQHANDGQLVQEGTTIQYMTSDKLTDGSLVLVQGENGEQYFLKQGHGGQFVLAEGQEHLVLEQGQEHLVLEQGQEHVVLEQGQEQLVMEQGQEHMVQGQEHLVLDQGQENLVQGQEHLVLDQGQENLVQGQEHLVLEQGQEHLVLDQGQENLVQGQEHLVLEQGQNNMVLEQGQVVLDPGQTHVLEQGQVVLEPGQTHHVLEQGQVVLEPGQEHLVLEQGQVVLKQDQEQVVQIEEHLVQEHGEQVILEPVGEHPDL